MLSIIYVECYFYSLTFMLSIIYAECRKKAKFAVCLFAERRYA
jgi:hypothetical protein